MAKYETKQRKTITEYLTKHIDEYLSSLEIADAMKDKGISRSAVYRNLADMEQEKKIHRYKKEGRRENFYRYSGCESCKNAIHLSCVDCGKSFHMDDVAADDLVRRIARSAQFVVDREETVIYGICINCLGKRERRRPR